jgi:hypothetical protein
VFVLIIGFTWILAAPAFPEVHHFLKIAVLLLVPFLLQPGMTASSGGIPWSSHHGDS